MKHCIEFCPECMAGPGNGVKSEQPPLPVYTEDGGMYVMGGDKLGGGMPLLGKDGAALQMVGKDGAGIQMVGKDGAGLQMVDKNGQGLALTENETFVPYSPLPGGDKNGGMYVDGGLGMPVGGGDKKTGGQFVVGDKVYDKEGYIVGKDGSLVTLFSIYFTFNLYSNKIYYPLISD